VNPDLPLSQHRRFQAQRLGCRGRLEGSLVHSIWLIHQRGVGPMGSTLGLVLRAPRAVRRRVARSSRSWRSCSSARVSPKRSGRMRPVSRCTGPASAGALGVTASAARRSGMGSGARIAGSPPPGRVGGLIGTDGAPNSSWSARRCRSLKELSTLAAVRGTRLLFRFTSTVNDGLAR